MAGKTYYEMLGVASGASDQDIRKAFLKLSLKAHPDKAGNTPEANNAFVALKEAYETLSNTEKRREYDLELEEKENPRTRTSHAKSESKHAKSGPKHTQRRSSRDREYRSSQPQNRGYDGYKSDGCRGEASSSRSYAPPPWASSSEFRSNHPSCPRAEYPRHAEIFAAGGRHYCLCHECERRILGDVYTRKAQVAEVIADVNFVNRHVSELWRAVPGLFSPDMRQRLIVLEQTAQAQLVFLDAWAGRTIAWVGCPSCTRRVLAHQVLADVEKMCRQIEYWVRHAPTLARLTRQVIMGPTIRDPWTWADEFTTALDKCRRNDL